MFIRAIRRSGRWFPKRGCILEHPIFRFAEIILHDRCSTSHDLASLFRGTRSSLKRWAAKTAKRIGTKPSAVHSTFHFWRSSRKLASFLMLSSAKIEESRWIEVLLMLSSLKTKEISQNSFRNLQQPTSPIGFQFLKLPPPPCAELLVNIEYRLCIILHTLFCEISYVITHHKISIF